MNFEWSDRVAEDARPRQVRWENLSEEIAEEFATIDRADERFEEGAVWLLESRAQKDVLGFNRRADRQRSLKSVTDKLFRQDHGLSIYGRLPTTTLRLAQLSGVHYADLRGRGKAFVKATVIAKLCIHCASRPRLEGQSRCTTCAKYQRDLTTRKCSERRAKGLCAACGRPSESGTWRCARCRALRRGIRTCSSSPCSFLAIDQGLCRTHLRAASRKTA